MIGAKFNPGNFFRRYSANSSVSIACSRGMSHLLTAINIGLANSTEFEANLIAEVSTISEQIKNMNEKFSALGDVFVSQVKCEQKNNCVNNRIDRVYWSITGIAGFVGIVLLIVKLYKM